MAGECVLRQRESSQQAGLVAQGGGDNNLARSPPEKSAAQKVGLTADPCEQSGCRHYASTKNDPGRFHHGLKRYNHMGKVPGDDLMRRMAVGQVRKRLPPARLDGRATRQSF